MAAARINRASIFMAASWTGLAGVLMFIGAHWVFDDKGIRTLGMLLLVGASLSMLFTRKADEYVAGLWNAGASAAFAAMLVLAFGLSFAQGFIDGLLDREGEPSLSADTVLTLEVAAFYIALFVKRLRGDI